MPLDQGSITIYAPSGESEARIHQELAALGAPEFSFQAWLKTGLSDGGLAEFAWFSRDHGQVSVEGLTSSIVQRTDWFVAPAFCRIPTRLQWPSRGSFVMLEPPYSQADLELILSEEGISGPIVVSVPPRSFFVGSDTQSGFEVVVQAKQLHERLEIASANVWWGGPDSGHPFAIPICPILGPQLPAEIPASNRLGMVVLAVALSALALFILRR